jgi:glycosyltransferase involved in cell wall biosynthesis
MTRPWPGSERPQVDESSAIPAIHDLRNPSVSILIETSNLSTAELGNLSECLRSLGAQTFSMDRVDEVFVLEASDVSTDALGEVCAEFPWAVVHSVAAGTGYGDVKALSATEAKGEIVVLCDADCAYEPDWLEHLLKPFCDRADVQIVSGETTTPIDGPYGLAIALTFVFPRFSGEDELTTALWYWANNVAVRRSFFASLPLPSGLPLYRGQNVVHANLLRKSKHAVWRQPRARALHQLPEPSALISRYVLFGEDTVTLAKLVGDRSGRFYRRGMEPSPHQIGRARHFVQRAGSVFREEPRRLVYLPFALPVVLMCVISYLVGMGRADWRLARHKTNAVPPDVR